MNFDTLCTELSEVIQLIGYVLVIFKWAIPFLIIGLGIFDFGKAVIAEKEDEIKKYTKRLIFRVIAGVVIFLIPNIILWLFSLSKNYNEEKNQLAFDACEKCFLEPWNC